MPLILPLSLNRIIYKLFYERPGEGTLCRKIKQKETRIEIYQRTFPALKDFTLVIEIEPTFIAAFVGCARICEKAADYRNAQDYVSQVLTLYPKSIEMLVWRARIRLKLLEFQGVIEDCSQAIEIEPTYAKAYLYRKKAHEALGKRGEAMKDQAIISGLIVRKASIK